MGFTETLLQEHVTAEHADTSVEVVSCVHVCVWKCWSFHIFKCVVYHGSSCFNL